MESIPIEAMTPLVEKPRATARARAEPRARSLRAQPASNGFAPGFMTDLMVKDLGLAMEVAEKGGVDARMGELAAALYTEHKEGGSGAKDFSSIIERL